MLNDVLKQAGMTHWAEWGLVIFFVCFIATTFWAWMRPGREMEHCSALPLDADFPPASTLEETNL